MSFSVSVIDQGLFEENLINTTDKSEGKFGITVQPEDIETRGLADCGDKTSFFSLDTFYFWGIKLFPGGICVQNFVLREP